uniref:Polyadenylate-binding protein 7 n=1 Tax=Tanacetum cinerariifolium TaxID=118510 RepID=A0A6L2KAT6_TANCI|nr:polyadenylate-binding protein 7 [Tanacetum cinerariifolium]
MLRSTPKTSGFEFPHWDRVFLPSLINKLNCANEIPSNPHRLKKKKKKPKSHYQKLEDVHRLKLEAATNGFGLIALNCSNGWCDSSWGLQYGDTAGMRMPLMLSLGNSVCGAEDNLQDECRLHHRLRLVFCVLHRQLWPRIKDYGIGNGSDIELIYEISTNEVIRSYYEANYNDHEDPSDRINLATETLDPVVKILSVAIVSPGIGSCKFGYKVKLGGGSANNFNEKIMSSTSLTCSIGAKALYVGRTQNKSKREQILRHKFKEWRKEQISKRQCSNVYVKNIDDDVTENELQECFS